MSFLNALKGKRVTIKIVVIFILFLFALSIGSCGTKSVKSSSLGQINTKITKIEYDSFPDKSKLVINGTTPLKYTIYKTSDPKMITIELYGAEYDNSVMDAIASVDDNAVSGIKLVKSENNSSSKLLVSLKNNVEYNVIPKGKVLAVEFMYRIEDMLKLTKDDLKESDSIKSARGFSINSDDNPVKHVNNVQKSEVKTAILLPEQTVTSKAVKSKIENITIEKSQSGININVTGVGALDDYASLELTDPARLIIDIWDVKNATGKDKILVASNSISSINIFEKKNKVRLVFNSKNDSLPQYDLSSDKSRIVVAVNEEEAPAAEGETKEEVAEPAAEEAPAAEPEEKKKEKTSGKRRVLTALEFDYTEKSSKVVVTTNTEAEYEVHEQTKNKVRLEFLNARLPKKLSRFLDTSHFSSNIIRIEPSKTDDGGVWIDITLKDEVPFTVVQDENKVYVEVENPYEVVEKVEEKIIEKEVTVIKKVIKKIVMTQEEAQEESKEVGGVSAREQKRLIMEEIKQAYLDIEKIGEKSFEEEKVFSGARMSLDFKDADIHNVLRLIAEVSGFNVVTGDDVKGKVSIHLNNVPWDQALDVILSVKDLGMIKKDNIILVVPVAKIKAQEERAKKQVKSLKQEKLAEIKRRQKELESLKPVELKVIPVNYADVVELKSQIELILSDRGSVSVDERTNVMIIKDLAENIEEAEELVAILDSATPQVLIEARIVEASTNFTKQFGIQWGSRYNAGPAYGNALPYAFPNSFSLGGSAGDAANNYFVDLPAAVGETGGGAVDFSFGHIANTLTLDMRLSAMESSGEGRIVSSPRIVTLDNTEAVIEQGTSIPYETTSDSGTTTDFVDANLSLTVTPHITSDGSVLMDVKASKNSPNMAIIVNGEPAIDKKEARTKILVKDGETTVIGGIFVVNETEAEAGVPFFKDLPFVGWLFKTKQKTKIRNELLIFITPRILKNKSAKESL